MVSRFLWLTALWLFCSIAGANTMQPMSDVELGEVVAQEGSFFLADTIKSNELLNPNPNGYSNFTFHRMGLDARLDLNANISKFQLGCGGINDALTGPACDLDIDYLSFMGINAAGDRPGAPLSDFEMVRPYIELAIKNEGTAQREVVGIKVGAERVNGALSFGRTYNTTTTNMETGGGCNPSASAGAGVVGCNSGVNRLSGFLSLELSAGFQGRARILPYNVDLDGCVGRMDPRFGECGPGETPFFVEAGGTRLDRLHAAAIHLKVSGIDLNCFILDAACWTAQGSANLLVNEGYGQLSLDTKLLHFLTVPDSENFFISFQREPVAYPNYSKGIPRNDIPYDICNPAYGQVTARCQSAYAAAANTGWWLNAPGAKLLNIRPPERIDIGSVSWGTAISLFGPEGRLIIEDPKIGLQPSDNCWGSAKFC